MAAKNSNLRILTADEIWAAKDIKEDIVPIPEWGGAVRIRTFSKRQAAKMREDATHTDRHTKQEITDNDKFEALLFTQGVIDPHFEVEDYERMQDKSAVAVARILKAIMDASGLSDLAVTEASKSAAERPTPEVRVSLGAGIGDDADGVAQSDEQQ